MSFALLLRAGKKPEGNNVKTFIVTIVLMLAVLFNADAAMNEQLRVVEDLRHEQIVLPPTAPERSRLKIADTVMLVEADGGAGVLIYYDDLGTRWDIDYIEVYDIDGRLLLVAWVDRFGACQVAMDRGLLDADNPRIDGVLVNISLGQEI
jgi:hypothetical protein